MAATNKPAVDLTRKTIHKRFGELGHSNSSILSDSQFDLVRIIQFQNERSKILQIKSIVSKSQNSWPKGSRLLERSLLKKTAF